MRNNIFLVFLLILSAACKEQPTSSFVERNGVNMSYNKEGNGDTTLLFVHGWCINKEYWQQQVEVFSKKYTVVTMDLPGFGQSGKNRTVWNFADYTEDVKQLIEELHLKNVILIGHSMSGDMILDFSNKYPDLIIGITGIDNLHEPAAPMSEPDQKNVTSFFKLFKVKFDSVVTASMSSYLFQPSTDTTIKQRVMNDIYNTDSLMAVDVLQSLTFFAQEQQSRMKKLHHKLFLVNSDVLPVKLDSLNKYCAKGAEVLYVHNTGHYPMIEKPMEFNNALQQVIHQMKK